MQKLYEITAQFPDGVELDEVEILIVLATKKRFDLLEKESGRFHKRLDVLGRENWKMQKLGYSILKEK